MGCNVSRVELVPAFKRPIHVRVGILVICMDGAGQSFALLDTEVAGVILCAAMTADRCGGAGCEGGGDRSVLAPRVGKCQRHK